MERKGDAFLEAAERIPEPWHFFPHAYGVAADGLHGLTCFHAMFKAFLIPCSSHV